MHWDSTPTPTQPWLPERCHIYFCSTFLSVAVIKTLRYKAIQWNKGFICVTPLGFGSSLRKDMKQDLKQARSAKEINTAESVEEGCLLAHGKTHTWLVFLYSLGHGFQGMVLPTVGHPDIPLQTMARNQYDPDNPLTVRPYDPMLLKLTRNIYQRIRFYYETFRTINFCCFLPVHFYIGYCTIHNSKEM